MKGCHGAGAARHPAARDEGGERIRHPPYPDGIPTLLVIVTVAFFMIRIAPGGPFDRERALPPESKHVLAAYDLDQPLLAQYADYLLGVLQGDFGPSFKYRDFTVAELLAGPGSRRAWSAASRSCSRCRWRSARHARRPAPEPHRLRLCGHGDRDDQDRGPELRRSALLALIFGLAELAAGRGLERRRAAQPRPPGDRARAPSDRLHRALDPRQHDREVLHANFVRTARAQGLRERIVVVRHALKGALLPVVSYLGPATAWVVTSLPVVIETIFGIPGIGRYFIQGALNRDYTLVAGTVIIYGVLIILLNLLVDLLMGLLGRR